MKSSLPGHSRLAKFDCYDIKWKEKSGPVILDTLLGTSLWHSN